MITRINDPYTRERVVSSVAMLILRYLGVKDARLFLENPMRSEHNWLEEAITFFKSSPKPCGLGSYLECEVVFRALNCLKDGPKAFPLLRSFHALVRASFVRRQHHECFRRLKKFPTYYSECGYFGLQLLEIRLLSRQVIASPICPRL